MWLLLTHMIIMRKDLFIYLAALGYLVGHAGSLATGCKLLAAACGILAPRPGIEPTLYGEVLTNGPPGKSQFPFFKMASFPFLKLQFPPFKKICDSHNKLKICHFNLFFLSVVQWHMVHPQFCVTITSLVLEAFHLSEAVKHSFSLAILTINRKWEQPWGLPGSNW